MDNKAKIKLYNTLDREKQEFKPIYKDFVGLYNCGPTLYWYAHLGNMRAYIFVDVLRRVLEYNGYNVKHVMNYTDIGHLTSDADSGEDKMIKAVKREGKDLTPESVLEIAGFYRKAFDVDFFSLNNKKPLILCSASDYINEMIELNKILEKKGYAYRTDVGLIFDTSKYKNYAKLANLKPDQMRFGSRVKIDDQRRNPTDFALWITNQPNHIMQWDSPWGRGFPGWHIECSAMSMKHLGEQFDIHCGGQDHISVHHTNEIAQSEAITGKKWVNYWLHNRFLQVDGGKMAKSSGSILSISSVLEKGFKPLDYRYMNILAHYRSYLNFTWDALKQSSEAYNRLKNIIRELKLNNTSNMTSKYSEYKDEFVFAINDDLDTPKALSVLWNVLRDDELGNKEKLELALDFDKVFGLDLDKVSVCEKLAPDLMELIDERKKARENKDFKKSDEIRDLLKEKGVIVEDTDKGMVYRKE
jgi:cysteinyl-tRNA synthetase